MSKHQNRGAKTDYADAHRKPDRAAGVHGRIMLDAVARGNPGEIQMWAGLHRRDGPVRRLYPATGNSPPTGTRVAGMKA